VTFWFAGAGLVEFVQDIYGLSMKPDEPAKEEEKK
jgi:hypothetical protein